MGDYLEPRIGRDFTGPVAAGTIVPFRRWSIEPPRIGPVPSAARDDQNLNGLASLSWEPFADPALRVILRYEEEERLVAGRLIEEVPPSNCFEPMLPARIVSQQAVPRNDILHAWLFS
jgi:hypothetical protein